MELNIQESDLPKIRKKETGEMITSFTELSKLLKDKGVKNARQFVINIFNKNDGNQFKQTLLKGEDYTTKEHSICRTIFITKKGVNNLLNIINTESKTWN